MYIYNAARFLLGGIEAPANLDLEVSITLLKGQ
jgi:hypothetical protein